MAPIRTPFLRRAALAAVFSGAALAAFAQGMPPVQRSDAGNIEYVTGGVGLGESEAMKAAASQWPLALQFAVTGGGGKAQYAADIEVAIHDAGGKVLLQTVSKGPFLFARVDPGTYTVQATRQGTMKQQKVTVRQGRSAPVMFTWPAGQVN